MSYVECPSGLTGDIRNLVGEEIKLVSAGGRKKIFESYEKMLDACWTRTDNAGPYSSHGARPKWKNVLVGDRFFLYLQIRIATFGSDYSFKMQCLPGCRERFDWELDLERLTVKRLSKQDSELFGAGNRFCGNLPDGKSFDFRLPVGQDEAQQLSLSQDQDQDALIESMASTIYSIDEIGDHRYKIVAYLKKLSAGEILEILEIMQEHDCGIETEIEVECPYCHRIHDAELPFDKGFWKPRIRKKKKTETTIEE